MPNLHTEIEYKFDAKDVEFSHFCLWSMGHLPTAYITESCPDVYYVRGSDSVRHRWSGGGAGELTVKRRTSGNDLMHREEIDLFFDSSRTAIPDVDAFLVATGWQRLFTLMKGDVHVFAFDLAHGGKVYLSLYEVEKIDEKTRKSADRRRFLEVEIEKGSVYDTSASKEILDAWKLLIQREFGVGEPLNQSLFEIYSGRKTKTKRPNCSAT